MADQETWNPFEAPGAALGTVPKPPPTPAQIGRFWGMLFGAYFLGKIAVLVLQGILMGHFSKLFPYEVLGAALLFLGVALAGWFGPRLNLLNRLVEVPLFTLAAAWLIALVLMTVLLLTLGIEGFHLPGNMLGAFLESMLPKLFQPFLLLWAYLSVMGLVIWWRLRVHRLRAKA